MGQKWRESGQFVKKELQNMIKWKAQDMGFQGTSFKKSVLHINDRTVSDRVQRQQ